MRKRLAFIGVLVAIVCCWTACKGDVTTTGESILDPDDQIIVLVDTFALQSGIMSSEAITLQADSFLLGEIDTDYGVLRASILTQVACPEGFRYPEGFVVDSICLFLYYSSWVGDANSPMSINAYMMDKQTFRYSGTYNSDLKIEDYCTRDKSILTNRRIVIASEKRDSIQDSNGDYVPMVRMRVNDDFEQYFGKITSFTSQEEFNEQFKGLLLESSFGSSTVLNVTDVAFGVYYHFSYSKNGRDTIVDDMKAFYANSEVRTINHFAYQDKEQWVEELRKDSDVYDYIVAPAGVYTRLRFPIKKISDVIIHNMCNPRSGDTIKRPYVNKAEVRVAVENKFTGASSERGRDNWLQPADHMLLIREESAPRFFRKKELPSDTCALLCALTSGVDSLGNTIYYYTYDMSDLLTNYLHPLLADKSGKETRDSILNMVLVPVTVGTTITNTSATAITSVREQQTMSATQIRSAKNGMKFEIVYCGF